MPIPNSMADVSTNKLDNSPQGNESISTVDDHIRSLGAIIKRSAVSKTATYSTGTVTVGSEAGLYQVNPTGNITSIVGGFVGGVFDLVFTNSTKYTISSSSTITIAATVDVYAGVIATCERLETGVFKVLSITSSNDTRFTSIENNASTLTDRVSAAEGVNTSQNNSINALNTAVNNRGTIIFGVTDGSGFYGDQYISNMGNQWLHTYIVLTEGTWAVTGWSAMVHSGNVAASFNIALKRNDDTNEGVATPAVFASIDARGGIYVPVHFDAIVSVPAGQVWTYRLKTGGTVQLVENRQGSGLFGSSVGETRLYATRLY